MDLQEKTATRDGWSEIESNFFVERYNLYKDYVGKGKQFKTRKELFQLIAGEMSQCLQSKKTEPQLTTRYYTLTRRNKKVTSAVNMTQGTVVDMHGASLFDINNIQILNMDNSVVEGNESVIQGVAVDTNVITDVGIEEIEFDDTKSFVIDSNDAEVNDSETGVTEMVVVETGVETEANPTVAATATSTDLTDLDAIVLGVERINNQIRFSKFEGPARSSSPPTGIATIYSMSDNIMTATVDLTGSTENEPHLASMYDLTGPTENETHFASLNVDQTLGIRESSNAILTSIVKPSYTNVPSTSQSLSKTLLKHESKLADAASSSRNVSKKSQVSFTVEETKWLLDEYYTYMDEIGPMKLFRTKNVMWQTLALKMNAKFDSMRTADDLFKRVTHVIELKKNAVNRNGLSGGVREQIEYQDELEKIASLDDSIEPEVMRGINFIKYKRNNKDDNKEKPSSKKPRWDKPNKKGILNSLSETMMAIEKRKSERDAAREERRVESQKALLDLLGSLKKSGN